MYTTVDFQNFKNSFQDMGRGEQFSYEGFQTLFEMLEDYEYQTRQESEFDVIAICCSFSEYGSFEEVAEAYECITTMDDLADNTMYKMIPGGGFIIQDF